MDHDLAAAVGRRPAVKVQHGLAGLGRGGQALPIGGVERSTRVGQEENDVQLVPEDVLL